MSVKNDIAGTGVGLKLGYWGVGRFSILVCWVELKNRKIKYTSSKLNSMSQLLATSGL